VKWHDFIAALADSSKQSRQASCTINKATVAKLRVTELISVRKVLHVRRKCNTCITSDRTRQRLMHEIASDTEVAVNCCPEPLHDDDDKLTETYMQLAAQPGGSIGTTAT
jgi:hypothetical protein